MIFLPVVLSIIGPESIKNETKKELTTEMNSILTPLHDEDNAAKDIDLNEKI